MPSLARKRIRNRLVETKALRYRLVQMWIEVDPAPSHFVVEINADYLAIKLLFYLQWNDYFYSSRLAQYVASTEIIFISILFAWNVKWKMRVRSLLQTADEHCGLVLRWNLVLTIDCLLNDVMRLTYRTHEGEIFQIKITWDRRRFWVHLFNNIIKSIVLLDDRRE